MALASNIEALPTQNRGAGTQYVGRSIFLCTFSGMCAPKRWNNRVWERGKKRKKLGRERGEARTKVAGSESMVTPCLWQRRTEKAFWARQGVQVYLYMGIQTTTLIATSQWLRETWDDEQRNNFSSDGGGARALSDSIHLQHEWESTTLKSCKQVGSQKNPWWVSPHN